MWLASLPKPLWRLAVTTLVMAAWMLHQTRNNSRDLLRVLPRLPSDQFRKLLAPHALACAGGLAAAAAVLTAGLVRRGFGQKSLAASLLPWTFFGGLAAVLAGIAVSNIRQKRLGFGAKKMSVKAKSR